MAETVAMTKEILATKLVQEITKKGDHNNNVHVPEDYLLKEGFFKAIDAFDSWTNHLLIDFSLLSSSSSDDELAKLRSALSQWGYFQVYFVFPFSSSSSMFNLLALDNNLTKDVNY